MKYNVGILYSRDTAKISIPCLIISIVLSQDNITETLASQNITETELFRGFLEFEGLLKRIKSEGLLKRMQFEARYSYLLISRL